MPPLSYVIIAVLLAVLVVASFPVTMGFSILFFYWLFAAAACALAVAGAIRIALALRAPLWIAVALAAPGIFWVVYTLYNANFSASLTATVIFGLAGTIANTATGVGALRLLETMLAQRKAFWIGYSILAAAALSSSISLVAFLMGHGLAFNGFYYTIIAWPVTLLGTLVQYSAFIGFAVVISRRRHIEFWVGAVITALGLYSIYKIVAPMLSLSVPGQRDGLIMWLEPVFMLIGGAAVWRLGSVLTAQATTDAAAPLQQSPHSSTTWPSPPISAGLKIPVWLLMAVALLPALAAYFYAMKGDPGLANLLPVTTLTMILPTLAIYFFLVLSLYLVATRRNVVSVALLIAAILPFADFGFAQWSTARAHEAEAQTIAAIPRTSLSTIPQTLVWDSGTQAGRNGVWRIPAIQHLILEDPMLHKLSGLERPADLKHIPRTRPVDGVSLPDDYLLLKVGDQSSFEQRGTLYKLGPYELRHVSGGHDDLVAAWYRVFNPGPTTIPLLTIAGWYREPDIINNVDYDGSVETFLSKALVPAR